MPIKTVCRVPSFALLATALVPLATANPAAAQFIQALPDPNSPVERLGSYIRVLASSPRDLNALMGAGNAALQIGDANAALGFFSRAEEIAPSSGRAKAGLAAALANIEKPDDALRLFREAASLGAAPEAFARDRALAYDLTGDWRRAQRDYQIALQTNPADDETVRRYALSLGIAGNRAQALQVIDPLLRRQDQGAWRARAFIYAMTGDVGQANTVARQLMPAPMAASMSPLLSRLATLNAAERAHAVNFGTVPSNGTRLASADTSQALPPQVLSRPLVSRTQPPYVLQRAPTLAEAYASRPSQPSPSSGLIPAGEPLGRRDTSAATVARTTSAPVQLAVRDPIRAARPPVVAPTVAPAPVATLPEAALRPAPRPAPVTSDSLAAASAVQRVGPRIGPVGPARLPLEAQVAPTTVTLVPGTALPTPAGSAATITTPPVVTAAPVTTAPPPAASFVTPTPSPVASGASVPLFGPPAAEPVPSVAPAFETTSPGFTAPVASVAAPVVFPPTPRAAAPGARLAGLLSGIATEEESVAAELPSPRDLRLARVAARRKAAEQAAQGAAKLEEERAAKAQAAQAAEDARRNPARLWVQVATGANERGLPLTWRRIRTGNDAALAGLGAYSMAFKTTNRLLVGPVKSPAAARELVRALAKNGVGATTFSSDAGQEVVKVAGK